jgi:hypothetical protein
VTDYRMVTVSQNLTAQEYRGGTLQFRNRGSGEILHEVRKTGPRYALIMRVANKLFHRVLPIEGDVPRTALAGWFRCEKETENMASKCASLLELPPLNVFGRLPFRKIRHLGSLFVIVRVLVHRDLQSGSHFLNCLNGRNLTPQVAAK